MNSARWIGRLEFLLSLIFALMAIVAVAALGATVLSALTAPVGGVALTLPAGHKELDGLLRPEALLLPLGATATVATTQNSPAYAGLYLFTWLPSAVTVLLALGGLVRVLRRGRFSDRLLFSPATVTSLRRIAAVLIIGSPLSAILSVAAKALLANMLLRDFALTWPGETFLLGILIGFGLLAIAEIIRRGLALLTDLEGTV